MKIKKMDRLFVANVLYLSRNYLTFSDIHYLYQSQIILKMDYCCHISSGGVQSLFSSVVRVQNRFHSQVSDNFHTLSTQTQLRKPIATLSMANVQANSILWFQIIRLFTARTCHTTASLSFSFPLKTGTL